MGVFRLLNLSNVRRLTSEAHGSKETSWDVFVFLSKEERLDLYVQNLQ